MISDEMAYRQYLDGQEQAADLLVERYGDPLVYYLHGYLKDLHEAEDLMIEAFAQIFAKARPIHRRRTSTRLPATWRCAINGSTASPFCAWRSCLLSHRAMGWRTRNCSAASGSGSCTPLWNS